MATLPVRYGDDPGRSLEYTVEMLPDGLWLDFADGTFKAFASLTTAARDLPEGTGRRAGRYEDAYSGFATPPLTRKYAINVHDKSNSSITIVVLGDEARNGDFRPVDEPGSSGGSPKQPGFPAKLGATRTSVVLKNVPAGTAVSGWVGRKLLDADRANEATITAANLSGTEAALTLQGTGLANAPDEDATCYPIPVNS